MAKNEHLIRGASKLKARIATIRRNAIVAIDQGVTEIGALILKRTQERYLAGVDPDGNQWAPLKASTIKRKRYAPTRPKYRDRIGFSIGALFDSIQLIRGSSVGLFATSTGAGIRIGIGHSGSFGALQRSGEEISKYARIFQRGRKGQKARRFLGIGKKDIKDADNLLRARIRKLIQESK